MAKKTFSELGMRFKKLALTSKAYTDKKVSVNEIKLFVKGSANSGSLKTYILAKGSDTTLSNGDVSSERKIGEIDIPKDFLVKSGSVERVATSDIPYAGAVVGDYYIDLVVNSQAGDESAQHLYIPATSLVSTFAGSSAVSVNNNVISLTLGNTRNGLSVVSGEGLNLSLATPSSSGAMSSADKSLLDGLSSDLTFLTNAEIGSWFGYDATESASILGSVSDESITDAT